MMSRQSFWMKRIPCLAMAAACMTCLLPVSAEAQIFGGRVRNWLRGNSAARAERGPANGPVIIERNLVEPRIVLPGDPDPAYEAQPRYDDRTDYGPGVSERGRRESRLSIRRRASRSEDVYELESERPRARTAERALERSTAERRSVLRSPDEEREREEIVSDDRRASDLEADNFSDVEPRRGERTIRVDRFEKSASVRPAEDPYEEDLGSRELELRDARGRGDEQGLVETPPSGRRKTRADDRVRPAAAEEAEAAELPAAVDRNHPEAIDEFDMPRSAREGGVAEVQKEPATPKPKTEARLPAPPQTDGERQRANAEEELLPPPPDEQ